MAGRYALVDLTSGRVGIEPIKPAWRRALVGGRGLNVFLLARHAPPGCDPLGWQNALVFGAGLLTGASPDIDRMSITFKSPETGILGDGSIGGGFGAAMRAAGFDHVVVVGRALRPCVLWLEAGRIELRDAGAVWGATAQEAPARLRDALGPCEALVAGPAGERLVRFASVRSGAQRSARCGGGAVMGSKLLKAVAAPPGEARTADALRARVDALRATVEGSYAGRTLRERGTAVFYDAASTMGVLRVMNGQRGTWTDDLGKADWGEARPEFSTLGLLGPNLGIGDARGVQRLSAACNDLGLDTSSAGTYLAWALELAQRGLIDARLTGEALRWGDAAQMERLLRACAAREGFGNVLAEGSHAIRLGYYPREARAFFVGVKGLPQSDAFDVRFAKGFALGLAVASRGADHLRNRPGLEWFLSVPRAAKEALYGAGFDPDPASDEGKAAAVVASEDLFAVIDSAGLSKLFARGLNAPALLGFEEVADLARAAGEPFEPAELRRVGARIADLERAFNAREGATRADDTLPTRYFDEPLVDGLAKGQRIDRAGFERMLDEYYALRGWDAEGRLPPARAADAAALLAS